MAAMVAVVVDPMEAQDGTIWRVPIKEVVPHKQVVDQGIQMDRQEVSG